MSYRLVDEASRGRARRAPMAVETAARRLFTREEYHRMVVEFFDRHLAEQTEPAVPVA